MEGWERKSLGEACTLQRGFDLPKRKRKPGNIPLMSSSGCIDTHCEAKVCGPGVVTGRSGSIGSVFFVEEDFWPLNTTLYVKNFHGNNPRFIYHLLKSFDLDRFTSGAGVPTLNRNNVHGEPVWLPTSLDEQARIVAILDEAFAAIAVATAVVEEKLGLLAELKQSLLQQAFRGELTSG